MSSQTLMRTLLQAALIVIASPAVAASLNVSPILLETFAPQQMATLTLRNTGSVAIVGQVRVFAWTQVNGLDVLSPTHAITGSPPMAEIRPGTDYTIRVVRVDTQPVVGEEAYRLVVDEVPDASARRNGVVAVALRYVIPVFFVAPGAGQGRLTWSIVRSEGKSALMATNTGDRRIQLRDLALGGKPVAKGLSGYVLGHSQRTWPLASVSANLAVTAVSDRGPVSGTANGR
jgi:fimbrial chaperone protein